ncbi:MAG: flagellar biosynthesis anti-sigma factor FlgM [Candidatus Margulisbacteria bacterium]|nr:flagellar biosynthesis anti-sigma factor FlgM [Candidatus Margulisiibacteriota bacterium]
MPIELNAFDEFRKVQLNRSEIKRDREKVDSTKAAEPQEAKAVIEENNRALNLALNNKEFDVNLDKVKQIKEEIEKGNYKANSEKIAKRLVLGEKRGEFNLGLFDT